MSFEKPSNSTPETNETLEKRDFDEVVRIFEDTSEFLYEEMMKDVREVVDDWNSDWSKRIREEYPGWKKEDFKKLLAEFKEETIDSMRARMDVPEPPERKEEKDPEETARENLAELARIELELEHTSQMLKEIKNTQSKKGRPIATQDEFDSKKSYAESVQKKLQKLGFFGRLKDRQETERLKSDLRKTKQRMEVLEKQIASGDVVTKKEAVAAQKQQDQQLVDLKNKIDELLHRRSRLRFNIYDL